MKISFHTPNDKEMELVKKHIAEFMLDDTDLSNGQFLVATNDLGLIGFGRLRKYDGIVELCTLGVLANFQKRNIGRQMVAELLKKTDEPIYVVCVIPGFFEKCSFKVVDEYPDAIKSKLNFCVDKWTGWKREEYSVLVSR